MELPAPAISLEVGEKKSVTSLTDQTKEFGENSYSCNCMSWTFQKKRAVDVRSCKHLREILGDEHEDARTGDSGRSSGKATAKKAAGSSASASTSTSTSTSTFESPRTYAEPGSKKRPVAVPGQGGLKAKKAKTAAAEHDREDEGEQAGLTDPEEETDVAEGQKKGKKKAERKGGIELLLAQKFDLEGKKDPKGWWISEKLDGVRAYWDGQSALYSRTGNPFVAPPAFVAHLPKGVTLDGELFLGRDRFDETSGIVRTTTGTGNGAGKGGWGEIRYMIFDIPSLADQPFEQRLAAMNRLFPTAPTSTAISESAAFLNPAGEEEAKGKEGQGVVRVVEHELCEGREHLMERLQEVRRGGGEGLMLRQPASRYIPRRSATLLKVKTFYDAEARVLAYEPGKGKYDGMCGALICEMENKTTFSVGSGLTDERRGNPPKVGSIITYRFQDLTKSGVPRFPSFVGERFDVEGPKDAVVPSSARA
ncbi:hypothetical protein JCM11641_006279 [Rhodosporidiobolus odoratus]